MQTLPEYIQVIIDDVSRWAAGLVEQAVAALMPNGVPFGMEKLTEDEELLAYVEGLRGNQEAWDKWITEKVDRITKLLTDAQISEDDIMSAHPYGVAQAFALSYSYQQERVLMRKLKELGVGSGT